MATLRSLLLSIIVVPGLLLAQSNNIDLFDFVMTDAQLIAGAHIDAAKNSPFGQFVLSRLPASGMLLNIVMDETGIDPRSDLSEILVAWNGATNADARWLAAARGNLRASIVAIEVNAQKNGGTITRLPGLDLVTITEKNAMNQAAATVCIGLFTDGFTDLIGDCTSVQSAAQFGPTSGGAASAIGLIQSNAGGASVGGGIVAALSNLQASVNGNALNISLNVPEDALEQLFDQVSQPPSSHLTR
jgi:hypothetical protein